MNFNTIIFDMDDTLIDTKATILAGFNYALRGFGHSITVSDIEKMRSLTDKQLFLDRLSPEDAKIALARLWHYSKHSVTETILIDGMKDLLNEIYNANIMMGIWTGRDHVSANHILENHNIRHYFKEIVCGSQVIKNKPDPEGLLLLIKKLNVKSEFILHVGDHAHDVLGANAVGVKVAQVTWAYEASSVILHPCADYYFHHISDFFRCVNKEKGSFYVDSSSKKI